MAPPTIAYPDFVFVRHGQTGWNAEGRLQGQRDIPLNDVGRVQALRNGRIIADELPETKAYDFVASPLGRARETMEIVRRAMGLDPAAYRLDGELRELTFGDWEGFTYQEVEAREPGVMANREANKWAFVPPGGESYEMLSARVVDWFATLKVPSVIVAHGGVGRVMLAHLLDADPSECVAADFPQDRVFVWRGGEGRWV